MAGVCWRQSRVRLVRFQTSFVTYGVSVSFVGFCECSFACLGGFAVNSIIGFFLYDFHGFLFVARL